jgi:hypothetical protein
LPIPKHLPHLVYKTRREIRRIAELTEINIWPLDGHAKTHLRVVLRPPAQSEAIVTKQDYWSRAARARRLALWMNGGEERAALGALAAEYSEKAKEAEAQRRNGRETPRVGDAAKTGREDAERPLPAAAPRRPGRRA